MSTTKVKKMMKARNRLGQTFRFEHGGQQMTGVLEDAAILDGEPHCGLRLDWRSGNPPRVWVPVRDVQGL